MHFCLGGPQISAGGIGPRASNSMCTMAGRRELMDLCMDLFFTAAVVIAGSVTVNVILEMGDAGIF